jgi:hypothetical protein
VRGEKDFTMDIFRAEAMPSERVPNDWFAGTVWLDEIVATG